MRELLSRIKALGDENRLRILAALRERELCLCQIVELLELATSTVSKHMSLLHRARLVDARKRGRWTYFRLAEDDASAVARRVAEPILDALDPEPRIRQDARRLQEILRTDPEALCRRQAQCRRRE